MNPQQPNANDATRTHNSWKNVAPMSGLCTRCIDGCRGNCDSVQGNVAGAER